MTDANLAADDLKRQLVIVDPDDPNVPHLGLVGDTYTVLLSGKNTAGLLCLIDMHVPPGGGSPPVVSENSIVLSWAVLKVVRAVLPIDVAMFGFSTNSPFDSPQQSRLE